MYYEEERTTHSRRSTSSSFPNPFKILYDSAVATVENVAGAVVSGVETVGNAALSLGQAVVELGSIVNDKTLAYVTVSPEHIVELTNMPLFPWLDVKQEIVIVQKLQYLWKSGIDNELENLAQRLERPIITDFGSDVVRMYGWSPENRSKFLH